MSKIKKHRTRVPSRIRELANSLGVEYRIACEPENAEIYIEVPDGIVACYFQGTGVIFVRSETTFDSVVMNVILLHELAHAMLDGIGIRSKNYIQEEAMAHGMSMALAVNLGYKINKEVIFNINNWLKHNKRESLQWIAVK